MRKIKLCGDDQWISLRTQVHTSWGKCPIDHYSQGSLILLIPDSRLNARNSPGARPYCSRLPLKKKSQIERNRENLITRKIFTRIILNQKFPDLRYLNSFMKVQDIVQFSITCCTVSAARSINSGFWLVSAFLHKKHHLKCVTWQSHGVTWQSHDSHMTITWCHLTITWCHLTITWCHLTITWQSHDNHMTVTCSPCPSQSVWSGLKVTQNLIIKTLQIPLEHETKHISNSSLPKSNGCTSMTKLCNKREPPYLPQVVVSGPCPLLISVGPLRMVHTYLDPEKLNHLVLQCRLALGP